MPEDNWQYRSENMKCVTCTFYVPKLVKEGKTEYLSGLGRCRANPPTMKGFVAVFESDWCGYHRLDENKI